MPDKKEEIISEDANGKTVRVPPEFYEWLLDEQGRIRKATGKKPPLGTMIVSAFKNKANTPLLNENKNNPEIPSEIPGIGDRLPQFGDLITKIAEAAKTLEALSVTLGETATKALGDVDGGGARIPTTEDKLDEAEHKIRKIKADALGFKTTKTAALPDRKRTHPGIPGRKIG